jgi:hypothetical protein
MAMTDEGDRLVCTKPFTWFEVSRNGEGTEGEAFLCCPAWLDTPVGNVERQSVADVWNGATAQAVRESIHDGSFRHCSRARCPHLQATSGPVRRLDDVKDPEVRDVMRRRLTVLPYGPREINCSYDRSCNLSCPSCRAQVIVESRAKDRVLRIQQRLTEEALPEARLLYITGSGDPFGSPFFRRWLQTMRTEDMPKLETIQFHTNALLWTPRMWETLAPEVRALVRFADISIDAARPETYAINRRGGDFDTLLRNLEFIATLRTNGPLEWVGINMVVQANNFREMPDFVRLGQRFGFDMVYFQQLVNWGTFSAQEFAARAVHLPGHPERSALGEVLANPILAEPIVDLGNMRDVRNTLVAERRNPALRLGAMWSTLAAHVRAIRTGS